MNIMLFSSNRIFSKIICSASLIMIAVAAQASPIKTMTEAGTSDKSHGGNQFLKVACDGMTGNILVSHQVNKPPNIMATLLIRNGERRNAHRFFDVGSAYLTESHTSHDLSVGCLNRNGGIGIKLLSSDGSVDPVHLQIDREGRIFPDYSLTGYAILDPD
ncbi:hypothetical protein AB6B39_14625 [Algimonas porphyrae]